METKTPGRKVNPNSKRQQELEKRKELEEKGFEFKRGRKADPNSKRQQLLEKRKERLEGGQPLKPGRPKKSSE